MKSVWNGKSKISLLFCTVCCIMVLLPGCDDHPLLPGEGFYSYQGFRDWWRIPLVYPYQIYIADTFEYGDFERYDPSTPVADAKGEVLIPAITAFAETGNYWLCKNQKSFFAFHIKSGETECFASEQELISFLGQQKSSFPGWKDLRTFYKERWKRINKINRNIKFEFHTRQTNYYGKRIPLKMPWQIVIADHNAFISIYEISQAVSDQLPPQERTRLVENIVAANHDKNFVVFKQTDTDRPFGCLIYATGSVKNFSTQQELSGFIKLNYPDRALPEMMELEKLYDSMWQALESKYLPKLVNE